MYVLRKLPLVHDDILVKGCDGQSMYSVVQPNLDGTPGLAVQHIVFPLLRTERLSQREERGLAIIDSHGEAQVAAIYRLGGNECSL